MRQLRNNSHLEWKFNIFSGLPHICCMFFLSYSSYPNSSRFLNAHVKYMNVVQNKVHYCTIFLCSLDVGNILQGGDPLHASVNHKMGWGGHSWSKWVRFFLCKKQLPIWQGGKKAFFRTPKLHLDHLVRWPNDQNMSPFLMTTFGRVVSISGKKIPCQEI